MNEILVLECWLQWHLRHFEKPQFVQKTCKTHALKRFLLGRGENLKFDMKEAAKALTETRFLKFTKRSWEDELPFEKPFG